MFDEESASVELLDDDRHVALHDSKVRVEGSCEVVRDVLEPGRAVTTSPHCGGGCVEVVDLAMSAVVRDELIVEFLEL